MLQPGLKSMYQHGSELGRGKKFLSLSPPPMPTSDSCPQISISTMPCQFLRGHLEQTTIRPRHVYATITDLVPVKHAIPWMNLPVKYNQEITKNPLCASLRRHCENIFTCNGPLAWLSGNTLILWTSIIKQIWTPNLVHLNTQVIARYHQFW